MNISRSTTLRFLIIVIAVIVTTSGGLLWARPGAVACALLDQTSLTRWAGSKYSESSDSKKHERYDLLLEKARTRIEEIYGESKSTPRIVFFDSKEPIHFYKPNPYGSTQFFGNKACVFIGPKGQNIDVVAHELVHTDIHNILGTIDRTLYMPIWLDEGLAMQVDFRSRYDLERPSFNDLLAVHAWKSSREFFVTSEDGELTKRYAMAKARVGSWVEVMGSHNVYTNLKSLISGGMTSHTRDAGLTVP